MYLDKIDAIKLAAAARKVRDQLHESNPKKSDDVRFAILDLEYQLEQLDKAIEDCPSLVRDEAGNLV